MKFPATFDEFHFEFIATSPRGDKLLFTRYKDKSFCLQIIKRESEFLIKADKLSRISPVFIMQNALKSFAALHNLSLSFSNIHTKEDNNRIKEDFGILKDANYFTKEFKTEKEIWIEVGFGSGRHLLHLAKQNPNIQFIGLEIHKPSIEQVIKQCKIQNIKNIILCSFDARVFMQLLKSNTAGKIFVHFPVPWDKKPHRRVFSIPFIKEAMRVLKDTGTLELRTDSENYFAYSFEILQKEQKYEIKIRKNYNLKISSKYEDRWKKMEKNIYDIIITNSEKSPVKKVYGNLTFERDVSFSKIKENFTPSHIREKECFVHFEDIYVVNKNQGFIKLSLGSYEKCEHKYLLFKDNKVQYFPDISLPIEQNYKSHQKIKEFLYD